MKTANSIKKKILSLSTKERARINQYFFKTGVGQYGEGDVFIGVTVPQIRKIAKSADSDIPLIEVQKLIKDKIHEVRLCAILILVELFQKAKTKKQKKTYFDFYIRYTAYINNWDLVDVSAPIIVGEYISEFLVRKEESAFIEKYIKSKDLWENRIIILASFYQIKKGNEKMTFYISERFFAHKHDLIHKAVGWMLREVGKRVSEKVLREFLDNNILKLPRTTLRYAIERFPEKVRKEYLIRK